MTKPWSKLKSRIEALFAPGLPLAIHCNVYTKHDHGWTFDEPRHWIMLGHGPSGRIIWDFPGPFLGRQLKYWESGYGWDGRKPSEPSAAMRDYLDRPRASLMYPVDDPWELTAILRAADRRLGRQALLAWAQTLDPAHPALLVLQARWRVLEATG